MVRLQLLLNSRLGGSSRLKPDGVFGSRTEAAVRQIQQDAGLAESDVVDAHTWRALEQVPVSAPLPPAPWLKIALGELGVHEYSKFGRHSARIVEYRGETSLKATADETPRRSSFATGS